MEIQIDFLSGLAFGAILMSIAAHVAIKKGGRR